MCVWPSQEQSNMEGRLPEACPDGCGGDPHMARPTCRAGFQTRPPRDHAAFSGHRQGDQAPQDGTSVVPIPWAI